MWFGRRWQVETAAKLVSEIIDKGPPVAVTLGDNTPEGEFKRTVGCDKKTLGRLIGRQGSTIGYLQTHSKCRIQIDRDALPEPIVTVSADDEKTVEAGYEMVVSTIKDGPCAPAPHHRLPDRSFAAAATKALMMSALSYDLWVSGRRRRRPCRTRSGCSRPPCPSSSRSTAALLRWGLSPSSMVPSRRCEQQLRAFCLQCWRGRR